MKKLLLIVGLVVVVAFNSKGLLWSAEPKAEPKAAAAKAAVPKAAAETAEPKASTKAEEAKVPAKAVSKRDKNFQKAGQELLKETEGRLQCLKEAIDGYILTEIPEDGKVSSNEIITLRRKLWEFQKEKKKAERRLKLYDLSLVTEVDSELEKTVDGYFGFFRNRDSDDKIRRIFAELTGKDLEVENSLNVIKLLIGLLVGFLCVFLGIWLIGRAVREQELWAAVSGGLSVVIGAVILFLILFGG